MEGLPSGDGAPRQGPPTGPAGRRVPGGPPRHDLHRRGPGGRDEPHPGDAGDTARRTRAPSIDSRRVHPRGQEGWPRCAGAVAGGAAPERPDKAMDTFPANSTKQSNRVSPASAGTASEWRRRRDSNPRDGSPPTPLAGERLRPLGHVSEGTSSPNRDRPARARPAISFLRRNCPRTEEPEQFPPRLNFCRCTVAIRPTIRTAGNAERRIRSKLKHATVPKAPPCMLASPADRGIVFPDREVGFGEFAAHTRHRTRAA